MAESHQVFLNLAPSPQINILNVQSTWHIFGMVKKLSEIKQRLRSPWIKPPLNEHKTDFPTFFLIIMYVVPIGIDALG